MNPTENNLLQFAKLAPLDERKQKVLLRECRVHEKLLDKLELAIDRLLQDPADKLSPADIGRLLDFTIKLGRLNANVATDHVEHEHAWSQYHDPVFLAEIDREIEKVFGKPVDVTAEVKPVKQLPPPEPGGDRP
jgi:hypothetical protein